MADAATTLYQFVKPEVGASSDTWGGKWNTNTDDYDALLGAFTTTGASNAYAITTGLSLAAYVNGQSFWIRIATGNTGGATLNVDAIGAKFLRKNVAGTLTALASGDIAAGDYVRVTYNVGDDVFVVAAVGKYQASDATLTALAALSWSSGAALVQFTAADTVSLTLTPSVTDLTLSGVGKFAAGSAGSPAIQGSADPDTGFTFNGTNVMDWVSGGTARWRLNAAGSLISISGLNAIQAGSGTVGAPGQTFQADTDCGHYVIGPNNIGFALGGTKYVDYATTLTQFITPVQARVPLSSETSGTLTVASANRKCLLTGNVTLNDGVFTADDFTLFDPGTSNRTFTRDTGLTMYVNGTDAASATLAANQMGAAHWRSATVVVLTGAFT